MDLIVEPTGCVRAVYDESIEISTIGAVSIRRASYVDPDEEGRWYADLAPVSGPVLGPFAVRSEALEAERAWLNRHWLIPPS